MLASGILVITLNTTCVDLLPHVFGHWGTHEHAKHDLHAAASPLHTAAPPMAGAASLSDAGSLLEGAELVALLRAEQAECSRRFLETERRLNVALDLLSRRTPPGGRGGAQGIPPLVPFEPLRSQPVAVSARQAHPDVADLGFLSSHHGNTFYSSRAGAEPRPGAAGGENAM